MLGLVIFLIAAAGIIGAGIWYLNLPQPEETVVLDQESEAELEDERELEQGWKQSLWLLLPASWWSLKMKSDERE
jgi:hypothetical protein